MSKRIEQNHNKTIEKIKFIDFWATVAEELGAHRLELNINATQLERLFSERVVHSDYLKQLIITSLAHRSGKLTQVIDLNKLLDQLGETAYTLRQNSSDDLFDIELLEEIAWLISTRYRHLVEIPEPSNLSESSQVLSLDLYKTRAANRQP